MAIDKTLDYLNNEYEWVIDIEKYFDIVNHDTLISILRKRANRNVVNFLLNQQILAMRKGNRQGLVNPLEYYLR